MSFTEREFYFQTAPFIRSFSFALNAVSDGQAQQGTGTGQEQQGTGQEQQGTGQEQQGTSENN